METHAPVLSVQCARAGVCAGINASARKVINFVTATSADLDEIRLNIPQMPVQWQEWFLNLKNSSARIHPPANDRISDLAGNFA